MTPTYRQVAVMVEARRTKTGLGDGASGTGVHLGRKKGGKTVVATFRGLVAAGSRLWLWAKAHTGVAKLQAVSFLVGMTGLALVWVYGGFAAEAPPCRCRFI